MMRRSTSEYPADWEAIAHRTKVAAGWKCIRCKHTHHVPSGYCLTVHHCDMDPQNCRWWNLLALCQRCHLVIQAKVVLEQPWMFEHSEWFKPYVAGYYAHKNGHPDDEGWVRGHLEEMLAYGRPTEEHHGKPS